MHDSKRDRSILVLGGTGHYGQHVVRKLLEKGQHVRVLTRNATNARQVLGGEVEYIEGDITSSEAVSSSLKNTKAVVICVSALSRKTIRKMKVIERDAVLKVLEEAEKLGCDLLFKGAYTQSRLRQMILGGATSQILDQTTLPVFMAN